jgi:hypothetical protein
MSVRYMQKRFDVSGRPRRPVLHSMGLVLGAAVLLAACGGSSNNDQDAVAGSDATAGSDAAAQQDAASQADAAPSPDADTCPNPPSPGPSGMNGGRNCLTCHSNFTLAGTLYASINGGSVVPSATVKITDSNSQVLELVTGLDGNFYTSQSLAFPVSIQIDKCPDTVSMPAQATQGGCNSCHNDGNRIHLP